MCLMNNLKKPGELYNNNKINNTAGERRPFEIRVFILQLPDEAMRSSYVGSAAS